MARSAAQSSAVRRGLARSGSSGGFASGGRFAVVFDRGPEWQVGFVILKGNFAQLKQLGVPMWREVSANRARVDEVARQG